MEGMGSKIGGDQQGKKQPGVFDVGFRSGRCPCTCSHFSLHLFTLLVHAFTFFNTSEIHEYITYLFNKFITTIRLDIVVKIEE